MADAGQPSAPPCVLVVGATGYVGQFVIEALLREGCARVHATHRPGKEVTQLPEAVVCHAVDYTDAEAISSLLREVRPLAVVNCGAMSALGACEKDPVAAAAANCPQGLVEAFASEGEKENAAARLFIHFSTDIVFDGDPSKVYDEDVSPAPVNTYGRLKAEFDSFLLGRVEPHCVVLRLTNVIGPKHPYFASGTKFLQWLDERLRADAQTKLFEDELRNYVWVEDVAATVAKMVRGLPSELPPRGLLHCGGPEALTRIDVARALAAAKGYAPTYLEEGKELPRMVAVPRASVDLGYASPLCVRIKSTRLEAYLGRPLRNIAECIEENVGRI